MRIVRLDALGTEEFDAWHRLRAANPALDSPYFHPGFAAAVHASGRPVQVAVGRDDRGAVCALLPRHREARSCCDRSGGRAPTSRVRCSPRTIFPPLELLTDGVRGFAFDHLLEPCPDFEPWVESSRPSPYLDTTGGLDGYLGRASRSGKDNMGQARRRTAKAERDVGPVRFAADVVDEDALAE